MANNNTNTNNKNSNNNNNSTTLSLLLALCVTLILNVPASAAPASLSKDIQLSIEKETLHEGLHLSWKLDPSSLTTNASDISGFVISYTQSGSKNSNSSSSHPKTGSSDDTDFGLEFESSELLPNTRSISLHVQLVRDIELCVTANKKSGKPIKSCSDWSVETASGMDEKTLGKLIAGIAAGLIFMIPCGILVIYIIRKDRNMRAKSIYEEVGHEHLNKGFDVETDEKKEKQEKMKEVEVVVENKKEKVVGGGGGGGELRTLSVEGVRQANASGTTIYIHTDNQAGEMDTTSVRL